MCNCNTEDTKCCGDGAEGADCSCKDDTTTLSIDLNNVSIEQYNIIERASELLEMTLEEFMLSAATLEAINTINMDKAYKYTNDYNK